MVEGWKGGRMKDEGLFGRGGKSGGGRGGVEKGGVGEGERKEDGGDGCCNTATYSTGEGGAAMERERGERGERKEAKGGKAEGMVAVIQQHTQRERKPWLWMEREQIIML